MSDSVPYVGFSNDSLAKMERAKAGDEIICQKCARTHVLEDSTPPMLLFYKCGDAIYLGGIDGRLTVGKKADVASGREPA